MGKRARLRIKKEINKKEISDSEEEYQFDNLYQDFYFDNPQKIKQILLSNNNNKEIDEFTSFLSNVNFDNLNEKKCSNIINKEIVYTLSNLLKQTEISFKITNNVIKSLINIIIYTSENEVDFNIVNFFNDNLIPNVTIQLEQFKTEDNSILFLQKQNQQINLYQNIFNLLFLISDIINEKDLQINFTLLIKQIIIKFTCNQILKDQNIYRDIYSKSFHLLFQLISYFPFEINNHNALSEYISFGLNGLSSNFSTVTPVIQSCVICSLFYLNCVNSFEIKDNYTFNKKLIYKIYDEVKDNTQLSYSLKNLNECIEKYIKDDSENNFDKGNEILTRDITILEEQLQKYLNYLKTFSDIIENIDFSAMEVCDINKKEENDDEMELEAFDDNEINSIEYDSKYCEFISTTITKTYDNAIVNINTIFNFPELIYNITLFISSTEEIDEFMISAFDKMISIKDLIFQIAYNGFGLMNNIILNFTNENYNTIQIKNLLTLIVRYLKSINLNCNEQSLISVLIVLLRTIIDKYKSVINTFITNIYEFFDYKYLFQIMNKSIDDIFIKTNIIDIIAIIYSIENNTNNYYMFNKEVCNILYSMLFNESDCEVIAHIINAFMDIYQWDDVKLNSIFQKSGVILIMKNGVNEFKNKIKQLKKAREINNGVYAYLKETLTNMKRFIKYKEQFFKNLK